MRKHIKSVQQISLKICQHKSKNLLNEKVEQVSLLYNHSQKRNYFFFLPFFLFSSLFLSFLRLFIFFLLFPLFPFFSSLFLSFFRLFCFAVFFLLSPSFYPFSLFLLFSLSSLSFAFPFLFSFFVFGLPPLTYERRRKNLPVNGEKRSRETV